jgi:hypothetical protein
MAHLKKAASGHLYKTSTGHLAKGCPVIYSLTPCALGGDATCSYCTDPTEYMVFKFTGLSVCSGTDQAFADAMNGKCFIAQKTTSGFASCDYLLAISSYLTGTHTLGGVSRTGPFQLNGSLILFETGGAWLDVGTQYGPPFFDFAGHFMDDGGVCNYTSPYTIPNEATCALGYGMYGGSVTVYHLNWYASRMPGGATIYTKTNLLAYVGKVVELNDGVCYQVGDGTGHASDGAVTVVGSADNCYEAAIQQCSYAAA